MLARRRLLRGIVAGGSLALLAACAPAPPASGPPAAATAGQPTPLPTSSPTPDRAPPTQPPPGMNGDRAPETTAALDVLRRMTLEQKVGQLFMLGFEGIRLNPGNRSLVHDLHLGGVTLFSRNVETPRQLAELTRDLQAIADPVPLLISIDQEGGIVSRLAQGATVFPGAMALGATGDVALARQVAKTQADELLAVGVNMNLAPVVDVNTNPRNPVIGVRAFGSDPAMVGQFGAATVRGHQSHGVSAVAKHFPGHGDTSVDSHFDLPVVPHGLDRLRAFELLPFREAMSAGVDGIMTAHVYVPSLEPRGELPATLSARVLTGLLRERLGYQGLILTDALDMAAIVSRRTAAEAAVEAFLAGADLLLVSGITAEDRARLAEGPKLLLDSVRAGRVPLQRIEESVARILELKARRGVLGGGTPRKGLETVGTSAHQALASEVAQRAVTLVRDRAQLLPLRREQSVVVVTPEYPTRSLVVDDRGERPTLAHAIARLAGPAVELSVSDTPTEAEIRRAVDAAGRADVTVLATYDAARHPRQVELGRAVAATGRPVVMAMLRGPYDAAALPEIGTAVAVYGDRAVHLRACAAVLAGAVRPEGRLPVTMG